MTEKESDGNKLIAEFDGWKPYVVERNINLYEKNKLVLSISNLNYNEDWNLIMDIVEKIETLDYKVIFHHDNFYVLSDDEDIVCLKWDCGKINKETVFNGVIEFIKWYNKNKNE